MMKLAPLSVLVLLTGCVATSHVEREALPKGRAVDVHYVSRLEPAQLEAARSDAQKPARAASASTEPTSTSASSAAATGPFVRLHCVLHRIDAIEFQSLVPAEARSAFARVAPRADVERVLKASMESGSDTYMSRPTMLVKDGGRADICTINQQAFVQGFQIEHAASGLIANPNVEIAQEGIWFNMRAQSGAAQSIDIDVSVTQRELLRPLLEDRVRIPGSTTDVVVQVPLSVHQELTSQATMRPDEVLVLGGLVDNDGAHCVLVVVDAALDNGDGGAAVGHAAP